MSKLSNEIRFFHYISGLLDRQQSDPLCGHCKAFANTVLRIKDDMLELESVLAEDKEALSDDLSLLLQEARKRLRAIKVPEGAIGQKKAGKCRMPEGICFVKYSKALRDRVQ